MILALLLGTLVAPQDTGRLSLHDAVAAAIGSYPAVAVAQAQVDQAEANIGVARAALAPDVRLDASLMRYQEPMIVYPLHSLNLISPPVFDRTLVQPGVSVSYTLYDFGARAARIVAAGAQHDAAMTGVDATVQQVVARTAAAYLRVLASRDRMAAGDQDVAAVRAEVDRARKRFDAGKAAQLEVLRAEAELQRALADDLTSVDDLDLAERQLALVTGLPVHSVHGARLVALRLTDTMLMADSADSGRAALVARALSRNPDAVAAEDRARAARATASAARAMASPKIQASGAYLSPGSINGNFHPDWQVGVMMSYALFTGGATSSAVDAADAVARAATQTVRLVQLTAVSAVDQALATLHDAHARVSALESAEARSAEVVRIEALSRDVGEGTQTDYLTATADLLRTRVTLIDARHAEVLARIDLAAITGELSPEWLDRTVEPQP